MLVEAYLLTVAEMKAETPLFGRDMMQYVAGAFQRGAHSLKALLPATHHRRYDEWVQVLGSEQLELFQEEE